MKRCLVDVNIVLALLVRQHVHHTIVRRWFEALQAGEAELCRMVQLAAIRLLCNRNILGNDVLTAPHAWAVLETMLGDERVSFVTEPAGIDPILASLLVYPAPTGKLVSDAYLAAFAIAGSTRLTTLDAGFRQFAGLEVELLR
jgi:toxin-antitoxin system PIN domain toxin